jgi:hypothetical protein
MLHTLFDPVRSLAIQGIERDFSLMADIAGSRDPGAAMSNIGCVGLSIGCLVTSGGLLQSGASSALRIAENIARALF